MKQSTIDFAGKACTRRDQSFRVKLEDLVIDSWLVVKTFDKSEARQLAEGPVSRFILGQQHQMEVGLATCLTLLVVATPIGDVGLHADDGLDAFLTARLVKLDRTEHVSMVRQGERFHALILGEANHVRDGVDPIQKAEMAVYVKMAESIGSLGQMTSAEENFGVRFPLSPLVLWGGFPPGKGCDSLMWDTEGETLSVDGGTSD